MFVCFLFKNLSKICGTGEQREGIALCLILITASDGLHIPKPLTIQVNATPKCTSITQLVARKGASATIGKSELGDNT